MEMQWISVKDRVPNSDRLCLVRTVRSGSRQEVGFSVDRYGADIHQLGRKFWGCACTHTVTHWFDIAALTVPPESASMVQLEKMDGKEINGIVLVGEPTPIPGTNKLRCLANVDGALALVELSIKFAARPVAPVESAAS